MPPINLKQRFKLKLQQCLRYGSEQRWNIRIVVYDTKHPVEPPDEPILTFDFDYDGQGIQEVKNAIENRLNQLVDEITDNVANAVLNVTNQYTGS